MRTRTTIQLFPLRVVVETFDTPRSSHPVVIETTGESLRPGPAVAKCGHVAEAIEVAS